MTKEFWNKIFEGGQKYRPLKEEQLDRILKHAAKLMGVPPRDVADVAAGTGGITLALARRNLHVVAFDISSVALEGIRKIARQEGLEKKIQTVEVDFDNLFEEKHSSTFDIVFLKLAIAFAKDKTRSLLNVSKLLRPGSVLVIITPVLIAGQNYDERQLSISISRTEIEEILNKEFKKVEVFSEEGDSSWPLVTYLVQV